MCSWTFTFHSVERREYALRLWSAWAGENRLLSNCSLKQPFEIFETFCFEAGLVFLCVTGQKMETRSVIFSATQRFTKKRARLKQKSVKKRAASRLWEDLVRWLWRPECHVWRSRRYRYATVLLVYLRLTSVWLIKPHPADLMLNCGLYNATAYFYIWTTAV